MFKALAQAARLREVGTREDRPKHRSEGTSLVASRNTYGVEAADATCEKKVAAAGAASPAAGALTEAECEQQCAVKMSIVVRLYPNGEQAAFRACKC